MYVGSGVLMQTSCAVRFPYYQMIALHMQIIVVLSQRPLFFVKERGLRDKASS